MEEELKKEIEKLKSQLLELTEENACFRDMVMDFEMSMNMEKEKREELEKKLEQKQDKDHEQNRDAKSFTPTLSDKYADARFLSTEERKDIKFAMISNTLNCLRYDNGEPARFYGFQRENEENERRPEKDDGLTAINLGTFTTPIAGKYRFDVAGYMDGSGKAEWYLCCVPKEKDYQEDSDSDDDSFDNDDNEDSAAAAAAKKRKEERKEKERIFKEATKRHLLFKFDSDEDKYRHIGCVGIEECDKGMKFWTEVIVLEGKFQQHSSFCKFGGRLVC